MIERLRVGVVQMTSGEDVSSNLARVDRLTREAAVNGADLVVFPENTLFTRITPGRDVIGVTASDLRPVAALADELGVTILLTTPTVDDAALPGGAAPDGRLANATWLCEPGVPPRIVYQKIHLFDVDVPGAPASRESATFRAGRAPAIVDVAGWRVGLSICYDLRFPELYLRYADRVDVIAVPSAFLVPTGRAHWHVLLRARAIEGQCFVVAPAQTGTHRAGDHARQTFGHALVVDPWGEVSSDQDGAEGVVVVTLERSRLTEVRGQIPMADHRRLC